MTCGEVVLHNVRQPQTSPGKHFPSQGQSDNIKKRVRELSCVMQERESTREFKGSGQLYM